MNNLKKLKIAVITQADLYAIPRNFKLLCDSEIITISELIIVNSKGSLGNNKFLFVKGFGIKQTINMAIKTLYLKFLACVANKLKFLKKFQWLDLKGLCSLNNIPYIIEEDINSRRVLERLEKSNLDVIVSFSAPTVFKKNLLELPKYACINLHCSALPSYSGVMPSFWVLSNNESTAGASVHIMDSKIDNGDVLAQEVIDISHIDNMYELIKTTKICGGKLMLDTLEYIQMNRKLPDKVDTSHNEYGYYSWPTAKDFNELLKKGKRLI